jgi:putative ABC transport system permease protein
MILQSLKMALSSIGQNKMRSFLTMLGIIIGVMAVVVLVSITTSATDSVTDEFQSMGTNKLSVNVMGSRNQTLSLNEVEGLAQEYDSIEYAVAETTQNSTVKAGETSQSASIVGTTGGYADINSLEMASGRFIKSPDVENNIAVAVLGGEIAETLFGTGQAAVGQNISIDGRSFQVVGVLADSGSTLMGSNDSNVMIPYTVAQRMYYIQGVSSFTVLATDSGAVDAAEQDIENFMMAKFKDEDSYNIMNQSTMLESLDSVTNTMAMMLGGIAGISLLVGGIGIMNIMLVSVTERTKEIGIRKAIGAGKKRILSQFLVEALMLSITGGLIGIGASWALLTILSATMGATYVMSAGIALLAVLFSLAIGVLFGLSPANKAAKMPPIQALRTE